MYILIGVITFFINLVVSTAFSGMFHSGATASYFYVIIASLWFLSGTIAACTYVLVKAINNSIEDKNMDSNDNEVE